LFGSEVLPRHRSEVHQDQSDKLAVYATDFIYSSVWHNVSNIRHKMMYVLMQEYFKKRSSRHLFGNE